MNPPRPHTLQKLLMLLTASSHTQLHYIYIMHAVYVTRNNNSPCRQLIEQSRSLNYHLKIIAPDQFAPGLLNKQSSHLSHPGQII